MAVWWDDSKRVCNRCHAKLSVRQDLATRALLVMAPSIPCLERLTAVCHDWRRPASYCLSILFQIQNKRPTQTLTGYEKNLLLRNRKYWPGHR